MSIVEAPTNLGGPIEEGPETLKLTGADAEQELLAYTRMVDAEMKTDDGPIKRFQKTVEVAARTLEDRRGGRESDFSIPGYFSGAVRFFIETGRLDIQELVKAISGEPNKELHPELYKELQKSFLRNGLPESYFVKVYQEIQRQKAQPPLFGADPDQLSYR